MNDGDLYICAKQNTTFLKAGDNIFTQNKYFNEDLQLAKKDINIEDETKSGDITVNSNEDLQLEEKIVKEIKNRDIDLTLGAKQGRLKIHWQNLHNKGVGQSD